MLFKEGKVSMRQETYGSRSVNLHRNTPESNPNKLFTKRNAKLAGFVLTLVALGVGYIAYNVIKSDDKPSEDVNAMPPIEQQPTNPVETNVVAPIETNETQEAPIVHEERLPTVEELEVDASLMNDPEKLVKTFEEDKFTDWMNAGANTENAKRWMEAKNADESNIIVSDLVDKYGELYTKALYIADWQSTPSLVESIDRMKRINKNTLEHYFITSFPDTNPEDKEPYKRGSKVTEVYPNNVLRNGTVLPVNGKIQIKTVQHDYDNASENRLGAQGVGVTGQDNTPTFTYIEVDGKIKVSNIVY